jgi:uncharacterized membrane protein YhiD involved in acid resistance
MINSILSVPSSGNTYSLENIVLNLLLSFFLSLIIALVYKKTHKGLSYSQNFLLALILMGLIICSVMMVIGNSIARAFGAFGAFSLIRFRTAIKDSRDMAYIFLALAIGMAVATNNYIIAFALVIFAIGIVLVLTKINFGSIKKYDYVLTFILKTKDGFKTETYREIFKEYLRVDDLLNINTLRGGSLLELSYSIRFFDEEKREEFIKKLNGIHGISEVNLVAAKNDIEY